MRFSTALRQPTRKRLERLGEVDIVIGIPCFNNEKTIAHVINTIENGLSIHYPSHKSVVLLADGGSVDDSREEADELEGFSDHNRLREYQNKVSYDSPLLGG